MRSARSTGRLRSGPVNPNSYNTVVGDWRMDWTHSRIMSTAHAATALVVLCDEGWEAFPFGLEGVEATAGEVACCVGHLADDSDRQ